MKGATGLNGKGQTIVFMKGPEHCGGLEPDEALDTACTLEDHARTIIGDAAEAMRKRASELIEHAIRREREK